MARTDNRGGSDTEQALTRKLGPLPVWAWAAVGVAIALFWTKKKGSSSSSSSGAQSGSPFGYSLASMGQASSLAGTPYGSAYPIGYSDYSSGADLAGVLQQLSTQVSALGAGNSGTNKTPASSPGSTQTSAANQTAPAAAASAFNPYPVGTVVQPNGEKIVQAVSSPYGWVDVTSLGGLYTSPGSYVTGSAIGQKALAGSTPFSAQVQGNTVYEYTGQGVKTVSLVGS